MKMRACLVLAWLTHLPVQAAELDHEGALRTPSAPTVARFLVHAGVAEDLSPPGRSMNARSSQPGRLIVAPLRESPLAVAIGRAAKKGVIEVGVEGYAEVLVQCQKEQSVVLTTPFMRSDSQQAHCYRF